MSDITIPPEAVEAGAMALYSVRCKITAVASGARLSDFEPWGGVATNDQDDYRYEATAAITAALKAWPGMRFMVDIDTGDDAAIKLPLTEKHDAEA